MSQSIYFDNAATTAVAPEVVEVMIPHFQEHYGNPSSIHSLGRKSRAAIEKARKTIAQQLNTSTAEIYFTSGGTESNNMVLKNAINDLKVTRIITSKLEHHCVLHTCDFLKNQGIQVDYVNVDAKGVFDLAHLETLLKEDKGSNTLVSLIHANNEIGTINDWHTIGTISKKYGAFFHADTVQTIAHYPIDLQKIPVDFISASAHKFHGPKGIGFLYIKGDVRLTPFMHGGAQERNMRAGTENVAGIVGMAKAFELMYENLDIHTDYIKGLKNYLINQLKTSFPSVEFNGDISDDSLYTVVNVGLPTDTAADMLMFNLDIHGICCSAGSACSSGADKGSHVIESLPNNHKNPAIRFSFSKYNTTDDIDHLLQTLKEIL